MARWRNLFEENLPPVDQRGYGREYEFGPPATADELEAAERVLGFPLPPDVREMLSEFNGVWERTRHTGGFELRDIAYLDLQHMTATVPENLSASSDTLPDAADLRKVVFVAQSNGFGDMWGVCAEEVAGHPAGAVICLDHEVGELKACYPSLAAFISAGRYDSSNK